MKNLPPARPGVAPRRRRWIRLLIRPVAPPLVAIGVVMLGAPSFATDQSVPRVNGDDARRLLGDGTDVVVGIVDTGIDSTHPALAGTDSRGRPRLVAQKNFVTTEPNNTGDDLTYHGTAVTGILLGRDPRYGGIATDARYVNARIVNAAGTQLETSWAANGIGYAIDQGAQVVNLTFRVFETGSSGAGVLSRMIDWASSERKVVFVPISHNAGQFDSDRIRSPGDAFNGLTIGATSAASGYGRVWESSSYGPTDDGRTKPEVVAPGEFISTLNYKWETESDYRIDMDSGTSFAAPHLSGILACQIEYGHDHGLATDPLVLKATVVNSAEKVRDRNDQPWRPAASRTAGGIRVFDRPLNESAGAGQIDGLRLFEQYSAGEQKPGTVGERGWDLNTVTGTGSMDYAIGPRLLAGTTLAATLAWDRHVTRADDGDGVIDFGDTFNVVGRLDNLDLSLLLNGTVIARSQSTRDNLEHIYWPVATEGNYTVRVTRLAVTNSGDDEAYAVAWFGTAVPEPSWGVGIALTCLWLNGTGERKRGRSQLSNIVNDPFSSP